MSDTISPLVMIPVDRIDPHPHNPRRDLGDLTDLVKSIKAQGIRQNLLLVQNGTEEVNGLHYSRYTVVIGHRRLAAAREAGLTEVPASIADLTDAEQLELMLVENVQRTDLSPIEEAEGLQGLLDLGVTSAGIAKATGIRAARIKSRVQLLTLPEAAQAKVHEGQASLVDAAKLEDFVDDPKTLARLSAQLGTPNFGYAVQNAKDDRKRYAALQGLADALTTAGATEATEGPENGAYVGYVGSVAEVEKLTIPEGAVFVRRGSYVQVYGPAREREEADAEAIARDEEWARKREEMATLAAARATAYEVRDQWVREFTDGAKPTAKETAVLLGVVASLLLCGQPMRYRVGPWLGLEGSDRYDDAKVDKAAAKWSTGKPPASVMVLWIHLIIGTDVAPEHKPAFDALEACGYVVSDVERGWLSAG